MKPRTAPSLAPTRDKRTKICWRSSCCAWPKSRDSMSQNLSLRFYGPQAEKKGQPRPKGKTRRCSQRLCVNSAKRRGAIARARRRADGSVSGAACAVPVGLSGCVVCVVGAGRLLTETFSGDRNDTGYRITCGMHRRGQPELRATEPAGTHTHSLRFRGHMLGDQLGQFF